MSYFTQPFLYTVTIIFIIYKWRMPNMLSIYDRHNYIIFWPCPLVICFSYKTYYYSTNWLTWACNYIAALCVTACTCTVGTTILWSRVCAGSCSSVQPFTASYRTAAPGWPLCPAPIDCNTSKIMKLKQIYWGSLVDFYLNPIKTIQCNNKKIQFEKKYRDGPLLQKNKECLR